jgi:hypothetical protein
VVVSFVVNPDGKTEGARIAKATFVDFPYQGCVLNEVGRWSFPKLAEAPCQAEVGVELSERPTEKH